LIKLAWKAKYFCQAMLKKVQAQPIGRELKAMRIGVCTQGGG